MPEQLVFSLHFHLVLLAHPASTQIIRLPQKFHTSWVTNETKTSSISSKFPQMFPGICKRQSWCWQQKTRIHVLLMRARGEFGEMGEVHYSGRVQHTNTRGRNCRKIRKKAEIFQPFWLCFSGCLEYICCFYIAFKMH